MKFLKNQAGFAPSAVLIVIFVVAVAAFGAYRIMNSEAYWRRGRTDTYQLKATAQISQASGDTFPVVSLFWNAQRVSGLASYRIVRLDQGAKAYKTVAEVNNTNYADRKVSYSTSYTYNVVAIDKSGQVLSFGNAVAVTTPAAPSTAPTSVWDCKEYRAAYSVNPAGRTPMYSGYDLKTIIDSIPYGKVLEVKCPDNNAIGALWNGKTGAVNIKDISPNKP